MKHPTVYKFAVLAAISLACVGATFARPIEFSELSLLVRARESENSIKNQVTDRKLMHALTPQQESKLKSEGASDSLVSSLRNPNQIVSKDEAAAMEVAHEQKPKSPAANGEAMNGQSAQGKLFVFDVALGHPINLSQWGGYDYEVAFYAYRCAGEDIIEPVMIDPVRTVSVVSRNFPTAGLSEDETFARDSYRRQRFMATENDAHRFTPYDARRDLKDDRFNFSDTVSVRSDSASRPLAIDWSSPIVIEGVPYQLYPVYGAGGVSLYYINGGSSSVRLAVSTNR